MPDLPAPSWYRDPCGRHDLRYWDGRQWTQHVVTRGSQSIEPPVLHSPVSAVIQIGGQAAQAAHVAAAEASIQVVEETLFTTPILVVTQKTKLLEVNVGYGIQDQHRKQIGAVREVAQDTVRRVLTPGPDSHRQRVLQVVDVNGNVRLVLTRPSMWFRSKMTVASPRGTEIGQIVQKNLGLLKIHFSIESKGELLGSINGEDWESSALNIQDAAGNEIGRVSKKPARLGRQVFMKGEDYILEIHQHLEEPLRSLLVASPLAIDAALRRDRAGWQTALKTARRRHRNRPRWDDGG